MYNLKCNDYVKKIIFKKYKCYIFIKYENSLLCNKKVTKI